MGRKKIEEREEVGRGDDPIHPTNQLSSLIDFHVRPVSHLPFRTQLKCNVEGAGPISIQPCRFSRSPSRRHSARSAFACFSYFDHLIPILSTIQI